MIRALESFLLLLMLSFLLGCASLAHREFACENSSASGVGYVGLIFQVGDCAPFKSFRIETGDYYRTKKRYIDWEVSIYRTSRQSVPEVLEDFARAYNCSPAEYKTFADTIFYHKDEIFGHDFSRSPREVSLSIFNYIDRDPILRSNCI